MSGRAESGRTDGAGDEEPRPEPAHRPWVHPSELPAHPLGEHDDPGDAPRRRLALPLTAGLAGTLAVLGAGTLALGSIGSSGGTASPPAGRLAATPTALGGSPAVGPAPLEGVVVHVKAWTGAHARYASAVVVDEHGTLVTSAAAVAGAGSIEVEAGDGSVHPAEVVGLDRPNDLAVLRAEGAPLRPLLPLSERQRPPSTLSVGDECWVVSARRDGTVVALPGSIAAVGDVARHRGGWMVDVIRVEVPVTATSAGGAVFDARGDLIGIVTAPEGVGAVVVPAGQAYASIDDIVAHGEARHPWLGVKAVASHDGVTVESVAIGGPAHDAGIRAGDLFITVSSTEVASVADLMRAVRRHDEGDTITLVVRRGGETLDLAVRLSVRLSASP